MFGVMTIQVRPCSVKAGRLLEDKDHSLTRTKSCHGEGFVPFLHFVPFMNQMLKVESVDTSNVSVYSGQTL